MAKRFDVDGNGPFENVHGEYALFADIEAAEAERDGAVGALARSAAALNDLRAAFQTTVNVLSETESYSTKLQARIDAGVKLFEDFYWPPPDDSPEEAQRIRDIIAALKGETI